MKARKPYYFWTKENVLTEGRKFSSRAEWREKSVHSYHIACKNKWTDEIEYFKKQRKPRVAWTKILCAEKASEFTSKTAWQKGHPASYQYAYKRGWLKYCYKHLKPCN
jgi:hypothetical protein